MDRGIFDRTHLHFYTRRTAIDLLHAADLEVIQVRPTPVPLEQIWPARLSITMLKGLMAIQGLGLLLAPTLFGFQWIMVARGGGKRFNE
jgi:hypothetical protein